MKNRKKNIAISNFNKVKALVKDEFNNLSATVTFKKDDKSKQTIPLRKESLFSQNDKKIHAKQFMSNLNGIKHDIQAVSYIVNIIK